MMYCGRVSLRMIRVSGRVTYVVPVAATQLQHGGLEAELANPCAWLAVIPGKRDLTGVVVPGADQVDGLDIGGGAKRELELNSRHVERLTRLY